MAGRLQRIGVNLVFEHPQPVVGGKQWILNPDLVVALRLIKEGMNWVRPEEDFVVVARESFNERGEHQLIEIKREFLLDYLAARDLSLRLTYYHQRVENVPLLEGSEYAELTELQEERDGGRFELLIRDINDVFGGSWAMFRAWRTDIDEDEDAPVMGPENDRNTGHESSTGQRGGYEGVRIESEFWRDEWIDHQSQSIRVRRDTDTNLPQFIVETDGKRMASSELDNEDIGRWLWFRSSVVTELLGHRGFALKWYTAETFANFQPTRREKSLAQTSFCKIYCPKKLEPIRLAKFLPKLLALMICASVMHIRPDQRSQMPSSSQALTKASRI